MGGVAIDPTCSEEQKIEVWSDVGQILMYALESSFVPAGQCQTPRPVWIMIIKSQLPDCAHQLPDPRGC